MPGGVGEGDGEDDGRVQQDEDCRAAERLHRGPAQDGEGSCKPGGKELLNELNNFLLCAL